jgi:uncharacterized protein (DUF1501 family)
MNRRRTMSGSSRSQSETESVSRRDFLRAGGIGVVGVSLARRLAELREVAERRSCILLLMSGGPSQLETFDPKPEAPDGIRGPLGAIQTSVPGTFLSESLPRMASVADRFAILRSLHHDAAPIHETGLQLLQTGRLAEGYVRYPAFGSAIAASLGVRKNAPPYVVLPNELSKTGVNSYRGQSAGLLGDEFNPVIASDSDGTEHHRFVKRVLDQNVPESVVRNYGNTRFGRQFVQARQLVESGVRCVTVNLFDQLDEHVTWDCHGIGPWSPATVFDYRDVLCPQFDRAYVALLDDLTNAGLIDDTLVVAVGEFGRSPYMNENSGRDHWTKAWSAIFAGAGIAGGQTVGATDECGATPIDRPATPSEVVSTIYRCMGLDPGFAETENHQILVDAQPIHELLS